MKHYFFWGVTLFATAFLAVTLIPWRLVTWGKIETSPARTITVNAQATKEIQNTVARFNVEVSMTDANKETAVTHVNTKIAEVIQKIKDFGISDQDIETQNISVYQYQEPVYGVSVGSREGTPTMKWTASNMINVILHDVTKTSALTDLLQSSDATSVNGPMLGVDDTSTFEAELLQEAIGKAKEKAEKAIQATDGKLGKLLTVMEDQGAYPVPMMRASVEDMKAGAPVELGQTSLTKDVTVTFAIN